MITIDGNRIVLFKERIYSLLFQYLVHEILRSNSPKIFWVIVVKLVSDQNWFRK